MGGFSFWHILIFAIIVLLLFGGNRFSSMMGDVAKGLKSFKQGMADDDDEKMRRYEEQRRSDPPRQLPREVEADEEREDQSNERPHEPPPQLDQVLEQRLLGVVDILHGSGRWSIGSSSPACVSSNGKVGSVTSATGGISSA